MLPSRGFTRVSLGTALQHRIFSQAPLRSISRQARQVGSSRHFGTTLRGYGKTIAYSSPIGGLLGSRIGVVGIISSQTFLSSRRFASTESQATTSAAETASASTPESFPSDFSSLADLDGASLLNIPETIGYLHNLGLDYGWGPTSICQWAIEHLHITAGLPWWASILGVSLIIRLAIFKPTLDGGETSMKLNKLKKDPDYDAAYTRMVALAGNPEQRVQALQAKVEMSRIQAAHGVKLWRAFLPMIQVPFAIGMFRLTTGMTALPVPGMDTGGILWFTDLTAADPYMILPCVSTVVMVANYVINRDYLSPQTVALMKPAFYIMAPLGIWVTSSMSAGVTFYFAITAAMQFLQTWLGLQPWVRRYFKLSPLEVYKDDGTQPDTNPFAAIFAANHNTPGGGAHGGMQYQAPRTINTTARPAARAAAAAAPKQEGPIKTFKDTIAKASTTWNARQERGKKEADRIADSKKQKARTENQAFQRRQAERLRGKKRQ